ncbi:MAG: glycosidase [Candidatus Eisenbacteria bacterium]|nr:glycosidase [Candidatus Eisenbacteria bacterium]
MNRNRRIRVAAFPLAAALMLFLFLGPASPAFAADPSGGTSVRVVSDYEGQRLLVEGEEMMVFGMNWGYMPIGENYNYSLWNQPDDVIEAALAREMPLLREMGVNAIRQYAGIPPRWVRFIYERYGIYTVVNPLVARYGYTLDGVWIPMVDYSDARLRAAVKADIRALVEEFRGVPGVLMWLLGNENNYGLSWSSFEIEALPAGERDAARARYLYSLMGEIVDEIKRLDPHRPVAMANGDVQYIDIIAEECENLDVFGTNVYRGISSRDLFDVVKKKMNIPVMYTEFGADAYNAKEMREDQEMQARYLIGQWEEIYEQSSGKGRAGNAIGGFIFQWSDGWWKYGQEDRLDIHDTHASWPNGGYVEDYVEGENNMNEEWWGITAKGPSDHRGLYEVYPRAAYYALRRAFALDPYDPGTDLGKIRAHFGGIHPAAAALEARGDGAALLAEKREWVHLSGFRAEFETYNTGGERTSTPPSSATPGTSYPAFRGFDQLQSFYAEFEARPAENVTGMFSVNILGNVPDNPIDEIFYENRGRSRTVASEDGELDVGSLERVKVYQASMSWDDRHFLLDGFYRTGHLHWQFEGDFFGLYRNAYYGKNIDTYNGMAPVGFELAAKGSLEGLKVAYGPQLWWGANPAVLVKYRRNVGPLDATVVYHEDIAKNESATSSIAVPLPETRKLSLQFATSLGPFGVEAGGLWSGNTKVGEQFQIAEETATGYRVLRDEVVDSDTYGGKVKLTLERGRWHWYAQSAYMGVVADAGPTETITFTGWGLKDSGSGNQSNFLTGLAVNMGNFQIGPNILVQKPIVGPIPGDVPAPGRPRNVRDDPFAVLGNREMFGAELMIAYDPTPATWAWAWDNVVREDARFAASLGIVYRDMKTTRDATIYIAEDGVTQYAHAGAPPAQELWETQLGIISKISPRTRLAVGIYAGTAEPNGWDPDGEDSTLNRVIHRYGIGARLDHGPLAYVAYVRIDDFGPYDYHHDFNLTYPLQLMGDLSYNLGAPAWFDLPNTRVGIRGTWRSLNVHSNRYCPGLDAEGECDPTIDADDGSEWEIRTYVHLSI